MPGSICLKYGRGKNEPVVCHCFAQYKMGDGLIPYYINSKKTFINNKETPDNSKVRLKYFVACLDKFLHKLKNNNNGFLNMVNAVVLPGYIGYDRVGGVWKLYKSKILTFAINLKNIKSNMVAKVQ